MLCKILDSYLQPLNSEYGLLLRTHRTVNFGTFKIFVAEYKFCQIASELSKFHPTRKNFPCCELVHRVAIVSLV